MIACEWYAGTVVAMMGSMVDVAEFHTTVSSQGRVVLPAALRKALDLHEGDTLNLSLDQEGVVRMVTARQLANSLWEVYAGAEEAPAGSAAAELREMRDADAGQASANYERISARRAAIDRSEDDLTAELMADLGLAQPA